jgi:ATP-binding protein involved in chromosome partitioning
MINEDQIKDALRGVKYPGFNRDIVSFGLVKGVQISGKDVTVQLSLATRDPKVPSQIHETAQQALKAIPGIGRVDLQIQIKEPETPASQAAGQSSIPGVKKVIAVASGKGGVGKSTVAANLAVALQRKGCKVGLADCDLYGPSIALMFGTDERPMATELNSIIPVERFGVKIISMGLLLDDTSPVIVRGPMATRYTQQFLRGVEWGDLDFLVLDLPPGTGDIQLTIVQTVALDGAVIVTTPQEVALTDARKAVSMFAKVNVRILGIVENMSYFQCPSDGVRYHLFGQGGGAREAARLRVPLLAEIPLDVPTREGGDMGLPITLAAPAESPVSQVFADLAGKVAEAVAHR